MNHLELRPRQRDSLAEPIHLTKFSEATHEHSRLHARAHCELTHGLFVPLLFESQSGTLAYNGAVFSDCSERIVSHSEVIQFDGFSTFRPCGRDLVEFFNSSGRAISVQVDYFRAARDPRGIWLADKGRAKTLAA